MSQPLRWAWQKCPKWYDMDIIKPAKNEKLDCIGMWDEDNPLNIFNVARTHIPTVDQFGV
ncbi:hypothetical protein [Methanolobus bombayensis]|uniref:hypothetical protein n=1 Tax=Methanolobus bombayensis TaxID=38023 RepID=UPI001AE5FD9A|nr:hypothetical protein [Methanolobus bombayensis]